MTFFRPRKKSCRRPQIEMLETRQVLSTYFVSTTGKDTNPGTAALPFATIQHAADLAAPGDTVDVRAGNYTGFVMGWNTPKSGLPGKPITFVGEPNATIAWRNLKTADGIDLEGSSYITITGFKVYAMPRAGIRAVQDTNVVLTNNVCDHNGNWGIYTSFSNNLTIQNNTVSRTMVQHGIYIANTSANAVVTGNYVWGSKCGGIQFNGDASMGGTGVITNAIVMNNTITGNGSGGGSAINCDGLQNSLIANNVITGNLSSGISLFQSDAAAGSTNNIVANNTIVMASTARWAININTNSTGNQVYNNILFDQNTARGSISITSDSLAGFKSNNNLVSQFSLDGGGLSLAAWRAKTGQDLNSSVATIAQTLANTVANLALTTSTSVDLVASKSPAIGTGMNLSKYFTTNSKGVLRSATGAWNIGAL